MLRSNFFLTLCIVMAILTLVAENTVHAAPEPCKELMEMMRPHKPKKPEEKKPEPPTDPKEKKKERMKKMEKLIENFFGI